MATTSNSTSKRPSIFESRTLQDILSEIQSVYLRYSIPIVIAFSGGKDSTLALLLWWLAIAALPPDERTKPIYIVSSNTGVEQPDLIKRLKTSLARINQAAKEQGLPFAAYEVGPPVVDSMLVCMIGKGWAAPQQRFRWCTGRLKSTPSTLYVKSVIAENGRCIVVLGVRLDESTSRAASIKQYQVPGSLLGINGSIRGAYTYTPIVEFTNDDVWQVLLSYRITPWNDNNYELLTMYRQANGGDCPIIIGQVNAPSCGTGRMGCWICPLPTLNRSLESLVDRHDYYAPLLDYYDLVKRTTDPAHKLEYRDLRRNRAGEILMGGRSRQPTPGRYWMWFRQQLLRELLTAQMSIRRDGPEPDFCLITEAEIRAINHLWRTDPHQAVASDVAFTIYTEVTGETMRPWSPEDEHLLGRPQLRKSSTKKAIQFSLEDLFGVSNTA